jgi:hypothetical protein
MRDNVTQSECMAFRPFTAASLGAWLLVGCAAALPRGTTHTPSPFATFAEAEAAAVRIVPFTTAPAQLRELGFDPEQGSNVTLVPYPDVLARLVPYSGVPMEQLDPGIRECIAARTLCRGYVFHFERQKRDREGGFLGDFFNVHRVTHTTGWWFDALVVVSDDRVLFRNVAGQASTDHTERQTNPLGPLQPAGESAGAVLLH